MIIRLLSIAGAVSLLAGCGPGPGLIVLKNPSNGEIVQCRGATAYAIPAARDAENCAKAYESQGYRRLSN